MMFWITSLIGEVVLFLTRHLGGGHGSALPGLVVEKISPRFLSRLLARLPQGVVLVTGTNGKTTTTKIITDLLRADGYRVFTNPSGSNFTRGVISAALPQLKWGKLRADIAVLELDEAHAIHFVDQVQPKYSLLLNVLRDQLDRFGEIDNTAKLLNYVAEHTTDTVILNANDPRLSAIADNKKVSAKKAWFGYSGQAVEFYRTDDEIHTSKKNETETKVAKKTPIVTIDNLKNGKATYLIDNQAYTAKLQLFGIHNALNCAAALALIRVIEADGFDGKLMVGNLEQIKPAFGRGETIVVGKSNIRLILVKNPSGFQLSLASSSQLPTLIAINDAYADGRDVSWLWDVDYSNLSENKIHPIVAGVRAYDMALCLIYNQVDVTTVEPSLELAIESFVQKLAGKDGQIFTSYTAMLKIREFLERKQRECNGEK